MCKKAGVSLVVVKGPETNNVVTLSFVPTASLEDKRKQERELFQEKLKEMQHWSPNRLLKWVPKKFQKEVTDMIKERGFKIRGRSKYGK